MIYAENPKILVKNKNEIILDFDGKKVSIHENDEVCVLIDRLFGAMNYDTPTVLVIGFHSLYDYINGVDDSGDYEFDGSFAFLRGISVRHRS